MAFVQISTISKTQKGESSINKLVERGRTTGKYRLLGAGLTEVPTSVYDGKPLDGVAFWDEVPPQILDLSRNELQYLPNELGGLTELVSLYSQGLSALKELDLSSNQLEGALDASIGALSCLQILTLRQNRLTALPKELAGCGSLHELHLSFNQISTLPEELGELSSLSVLDVRNNTLRSFPVGACRLSLSLLDLSNNLAALPPELGRMTTLRALPLMGNPIRGYSSAVINGPISVLLTKLRHRLEDEDSRLDVKDAVSDDMLSLAISGNSTTICLANKDLCQVPEQVWDRGVQLKRLDLSNNKLQHFPADELARLSGLQTLLLARNQLHTWPLPNGMGILPHLQELSVAYSCHSPVPEDAFKACMASLTCLDLSGVPAPLHGCCLGGLTALKSLVWEKASLEVFPADIPQLTALQSLSLMSNNFAEVPYTVTHLMALTVLNLSKSNISSLPPQLGLLGTTLQRLSLECNPLRSIRRTILEKGTRAVLAYLKDRVPTSPEMPGSHF